MKGPVADNTCTEYIVQSDTPLTETRVMEPGDDGHSGIVTADFARDLERVARQMAEALDPFAASPDTSQHGGPRADYVKASLALAAWRAFEEKYK